MNSDYEKTNKLYKTARNSSIFLFIVATTIFFFGFSEFNKPILAVLLIHDVLANPTRSFQITPQKLEQYVKKFLEYDYKPVEPHDFENMLANGFSGRNFLVTFDDGTINEFEAIKNLYNKFGIKSALFLVEDSIGTPLNMDLDQLLLLKKQYGTYFGLHGKYHLPYPEVFENDPNIGVTLNNTIKRLNELTNSDIKWCSYPFGAHNMKIIEELKKHTPIKLAFTTDSGHIFSDSDIYALNRYMYMGGINPNYEDEIINFSLLPPEQEKNGKHLMQVALMLFLYCFSRLFYAIKYKKQLDKKE